MDNLELPVPLPLGADRFIDVSQISQELEGLPWGKEGLTRVQEDCSGLSGIAR